MGIKIWKRNSSCREAIYLGRSQSVRGDHQRDVDAAAKPKWQTFWRKLNREKKKIFSAPSTLPASYEPEEYSQNFDRGADSAEPEYLSRSFSARFANPSRFLQRNIVNGA